VDVGSVRFTERKRSKDILGNGTSESGLVLFAMSQFVRAVGFLRVTE
jgi:hypothetical protein